MPIRKLTDAFIRTAPLPTSGQTDYFDALLPAFGLRVSYGGAKTWFVTTRIAGKPKLVRIKLGRYPAMSLTDARHQARLQLETAAKGIDPRQVRDGEVADNARRAAQTFEVVTAEFLKLYAERRLRSSTIAEYRRAFDRAVDWQGLPVRDISKRDVLSLTESIEAKGQGVTADLTFAYLRKFFNWCVERDLLEVAPTDRIRRSLNAVSRDRVLTEAEVRIVWAALDKMPYPFGPMFKLLLLTGQRLGEVSGMRWDELRAWDGKAPLWEMPGDRTKNGLAHIVPVVPEVKSIIEAAPRVGPFVFTTTGETPSTGFSRAKAGLDKTITKACEKDELKPVPGWRLHDLRRTMVTHMNEDLSIMPHVVEAVINHISSGARSGVAGVYNRALYLDERRAALEKWAEWVTGDG